MADVWTWLKTCVDCGKIHEFRKPHGHSDQPGHQCRCMGTWADSNDGHNYRRRLPGVNVDALKAEYEASK